MFKKHNRLSAKLIPHTLKLGKQIRMPAFTLFVAKSVSLHVGVSISKKVSPLAVNRNYTKRILLNALQAQPDLPTAKYFFVVKDSQVSHAQLLQQLQIALSLT